MYIYICKLSILSVLALHVADIHNAWEHHPFITLNLSCKMFESLSIFFVLYFINLHAKSVKGNRVKCVQCIHLSFTENPCVRLRAS